MNGRMALLLFVTLSLICAPLASGEAAAAPVKGKEQVKRRVERERMFLQRALEELNRSHGYVRIAIGQLQQQIDAVEITGSPVHEGEAGSLKDWYRSYADWLNGAISALDGDLSSAYSVDRGGVVQPSRCESIADGYAMLTSQLEDRMGRLEKLRNRTLHRMDALKATLDYVASAEFREARKKDRERNPKEKSPHRWNDMIRDEQYERHKDITDADIGKMELEFRSLEELQARYVVLLETGRLEQSWISRKVGDYEELARLARYVGTQDLDAIEEADNRMIRRYESDIAYFKGKLDDISRARPGIDPPGSLKMLDRQEELSDTYDAMKDRFEKHITWLSQQAGAYRADIIQVRE